VNIDSRKMEGREGAGSAGGDRSYGQDKEAKGHAAIRGRVPRKLFSLGKTVQPLEEGCGREKKASDRRRHGIAYLTKEIEEGEGLARKWLSKSKGQFQQTGWEKDAKDKRGSSDLQKKNGQKEGV